MAESQKNPRGIPIEDISKKTNKTTGSEPGKDRTAVALRYDVGKDKAPFVIAAGRGPIAQEILRIADENSIPLYEDNDLAGILNKLQIDTEIPPQLYSLVAEVLFFVYKLERMASKRQEVVKKLKEEQAAIHRKTKGV